MPKTIKLRIAIQEIPFQLERDPLYLCVISVSMYAEQAWLREIVLDFDIPINLEYHNDDFIQDVIADRVEGIAAINEDKKMRNIARALNDEEIMNKILENGYPDS